MWVSEDWWFVQELPGKGITPDLRAPTLALTL
jgi:hypothetical protein